MEEMDSKKAGTPQAGMRDGLLTFFKGMFVGGTMLVPGVSGGSMAIILGVYDRLVSSVSSFFKQQTGKFPLPADLCPRGRDRDARCSPIPCSA